MASPIAGISNSGVHADGSYSPDAARAALTLPAVAPVIIPALVNANGFGGLTFQFGHIISTDIGTVDIADQDAAPTKPADKAVSFSTYGVVIPISLGKRRMSGNVIESTNIVSVMLGSYDYFVEYQIPITTTDELQGEIHPDSNQDNDDFLHAETDRDTVTTRVFQNDDPDSPNWVDVENPKAIDFKNPVNGQSKRYQFIF